MPTEKLSCGLSWVGNSSPGVGGAAGGTVADPGLRIFRQCIRIFLCSVETIDTARARTHVTCPGYDRCHECHDSPAFAR
jgi:hypothetical protein